VFDNVATTGFFWEIVAHHHVVAGHIIFECKNYAEDPENPEFDQLSGRLGRGAGQFRILTCRTVTDHAKALARQKDAVRRDQRIIVITDNDIIRLIESTIEGKRGDVDNLLRAKLRELDFA
jgi:hypothetical protein